MKHDVRAGEAWTIRGNHALLSFLHQQSPVLETLPEISPLLSKHDVPDQLTSFVFLSLMQGNHISPMHPISENQGKKQDITCKKNGSAPKQNIFLYQGIIVDININFNNLRYADDITLMAESEEELESLLMKVKVESEKFGLKLNIQKTKIMASGPTTSWEIDGETVETVSDFIFLGSKITTDGD